MKALVLAAGEGTRLRPLTLDKPKPMLPIAGKPLLEHTIEWLKHHGITQIAINLHHKPEAITSHFGDGHRWGVEITYSYENPILGTAGAIKKLEDYFDGTFVVFYGDVLTDMNLSALIEFHRKTRRAEDGNPSSVFRLPSSVFRPPSSAFRSPSSVFLLPLATIALYRVPNPTECGIVELAPDGRITRLVEKPPPEEVFSDLASAGVMVMEPGVTDFIPPDTFYDIGYHLLPDLIARGIPVYGVPIAAHEYLIDIGTPEKYERAQYEWGRR